jgi:hypothetical protein
MRTPTYSRDRTAIVLSVLMCTALFGVYIARADDITDDKSTATDPKSVVSEGKSTTTADQQTEEYKNWIELGIGGVVVHGDEAQFEQEHRLPANQPYGGIQDLHLEQSLGNDVQLTVDGHALWDFNDYHVVVDLSKPKLGYIRFGYDEFRSWYDGNGGFFPHHDIFFPPVFPEMHIDRGEAWVELGLRVPDFPEITIRYSHEFRDGMKDSTVWGDTTLTDLKVAPARKIVPSFRDVDETRDIVALDVSKTFGNTDVLLGMRYEHNENDYSLNMERGAGQLPPVVAPPGAQRFVTQHQNDDVDMFSGHAITETRLTDTLWFTAGYSYTTMENDLSGTRIFGTHFDSAFGEPVPTLGQRDHAFIDLDGTAEVREHVFNANVFWMPFENLEILTAFRYTHEDRDSASTFLALEPVKNTAPFTPLNPKGGFHYGPPAPESGDRSSDYNRYAQRLELRYTGIKNWLFYAQGEWQEEWGHVDETQSPDEEVPLDKDTRAIGQKYSIGANWYPMMRLNISLQYYHKSDSYDDTDIRSASFPRLINQDWNTDDVNVRFTWQPKVPTWLGTLALVSRYDFIRTKIGGQWEIFSNGELLADQETGKITRHSITESITWSPLARLYLQTDFSYVLNQTETPASKIDLIPNTSPTVVNFRNDFWTVTAGAGYLIDDKTDIRADYSFYRANDYFNNAKVAVPYGMGATEHTASVTATRQITKNTRLLVKYTYFHYTDELFGGHNNYEAHSIYSGLQIRF